MNYDISRGAPAQTGCIPEAMGYVRCHACNGAGTKDCPKCGGSGDASHPRMSDAAVQISELKNKNSAGRGSP